MILCEHCFINPIKGKVECGIIHMEIINEFSNQSLLKSFSDVMDYIKIFNTHRIDDMTKERIETPLFDE